VHTVEVVRINFGICSRIFEEHTNTHTKDRHRRNVIFASDVRPCAPFHNFVLMPPCLHVSFSQSPGPRVLGRSVAARCARGQAPPCIPAVQHAFHHRRRRFARECRRKDVPAGAVPGEGFGTRRTRQRQMAGCKRACKLHWPPSPTYAFPSPARCFFSLALPCPSYSVSPLSIEAL